MPVDLEGAMQTNTSTFTKIETGEGVYSGYFTGMGETYEQHAYQPNCQPCNKQGRLSNGDMCVMCNGTGRALETKVPLFYELENGKVESESVTFKLSSGGKKKDGGALSPSTLFLRLRTFSDLDTPAAINEWWKSVRDDVRIPVTVIIKMNSTGKALKIAEVIKRNEPVKSEPQDLLSAAKAKIK